MFVCTAEIALDARCAPFAPRHAQPAPLAATVGGLQQSVSRPPRRYPVPHALVTGCLYLQSDAATAACCVFCQIAQGSSAQVTHTHTHSGAGKLMLIMLNAAPAKPHVHGTAASAAATVRSDGLGRPCPRPRRGYVGPQRAHTPAPRAPARDTRHVLKWGAPARDTRHADWLAGKKQLCETRVLQEAEAHPTHF
jgi:hypothetical protein